MSLAFRNVTSAPLDNLDVVAPDGTVVGIVGENGSGKSRLLRLAAGLETPASGTVKASGNVRWLGPDDALNLAPAPVLRVETVGESGKPTMVWRSGERAVVRVAVRFREAVADPVVGIMIRTRIGLNVYGTNTELEQLKLGPCMAGNTLELAFAFWCELCPGEYTLTAASHDPDGVWHDWLEDAVAFSVSDSRYTAGVANLHAQVSLLGRS
jgi:energy-coupling factor transporter ATP-binding protein EcfA2